jgi:hypothetical protein
MVSNRRGTEHWRCHFVPISINFLHISSGEEDPTTLPELLHGRGDLVRGSKSL